MTTENQTEQGLIDKLKDLKYTYRGDIRDRDGLEKNFREKFEALNGVHLTDAEFARLLDQIVTHDVFTAALSARAELENQKAKGAGTDGRADSCAAQTCARAGNYRAGGV